MTFHLFDSLPVKKLLALRDERNRWLALHPPPRTESQIREYHRNFSGAIQTWLDAGYGSCVLARPEIFHFMESVLNHFNGQRYMLGQYVVMPNHVHVLVRPLAGYDLDRILHSWKSFSANKINKIIGSRGPVWHRESFDHIVRSAAQLARIEEYIRDNPKSLSIDERIDTK